MILFSFTVCLLAIRIFIVFLHGIGIYLLLHLYSKELQRIPHLYLLNLTSGGLIGNFIGLLVIPYEKFGTIPDGILLHLAEVQYYLQTLIDIHVRLVDYATRIYITIDRLLDIKLNIKKPIYFNENKAKCLLLGTWVTGVLMYILFALIYKFTSCKYNYYFYKYAYTFCDALFIVISIYTYAFLFNKFRQAKVRPAVSLPGVPRSSRPRRCQRQNSFALFRRSKFTIMYFAIVMFVLLVFVPNQVYVFGRFTDNSVTEIVVSVTRLSYSLSNIVDVWVYVYSKPNVRRLVRRLLKKKLSWKRHRKSDMSNIVRRLQKMHTKESAVI